MSVLRQRRRGESFTVIPNVSINDERLSLRAKGLHGVLLSKPDHWQFSADRVAQECQEGRDAVRTAMRELKAAGYVTEEKRQDDLGRWSTIIEVSDLPAEPTPEKPSSVRPAETQLPTPENPTTGEPTVGESGVYGRTEEQGLTSKNKTSGAARRRGKSRVEAEGLTVVGGLPADGPSEAPEPAAIKNPPEAARYFRDKAKQAGPMDPRSETVILAVAAEVKRMTTGGTDLADVVAAIDLFFSSEGYQRPGRPFWKSFLAVRGDLLMTVEQRKVVEGEDWKARRARRLGTKPEARAAEQAELEGLTGAERHARWKAAKLAAKGISA